MADKKPFDPDRAYDIDRDWDLFEHKIVTPPGALAEVDEEGYIRVTVHLKSKHWIGMEEHEAPECDRALSFKIHLRDFWLMAPGCQPPVRFCLGRRCKDATSEGNSNRSRGG